MKMKINRACDLNSISVLPPHARRSSGVLPGPQSSQQLQSQAASQQSFSQGHSSQRGMFSQMSQSSLEESIMNDQRLGSQERENSVKKISCLAPLSYTREESQMPISRPSTSIMHKWNSTSISDHRCQFSEEIGHKIGMIETSVSRIGMILDSVQGDVMQVNKGTKEASLELEGMQQKLTGHDNLLQLMSKGQDDLKESLFGALKSITDQLSKNSYPDKLQEISLTLSALPERLETLLLKLKHELCNAFINEIKAMSATLKNSNKKHMESGDHLLKGICHGAALQKMQQPLKISNTLPKEHKRATSVKRVEMGSWNSVKLEKSPFTRRKSIMERNWSGYSSIQQENEWRVTIESDEEIEGGFSSLLEEKETGNYLIEEPNEETRRILRKARRRKRKHSNTIVID